jgi:hypothetical protein
MEDIEVLNEQWENNELTSHLWELINGNREDDFRELVMTNPAAAHVRSEDGRGPMWWVEIIGRVVSLLPFIRILTKPSPHSAFSLLRIVVASSGGHTNTSAQG